MTLYFVVIVVETKSLRNVTTFISFCVSSSQHILTYLSKQGTDDALDEDQRAGESELLLFVSLTIISSSAGRTERETTLCFSAKDHRQ